MDNGNNAERADRIKSALKSLNKSEFKKLLSLRFFKPRKIKKGVIEGQEADQGQ